jgi:GntR family transcriptional regulator, transcriptional repressor for pyruvate dehydrogenase complex
LEKSDSVLSTIPNTSSKIYLEVVEKIRSMIEESGLLPGDKIPSERELSERLKVGRSSVREALRALELLGLIETRRGEGTFIKDFQEHRLVELLGAFFLQDSKTKKDLAETKRFIEMDCLQAAVKRAGNEIIEECIAWAEENDFTDSEFFEKIAALNPNRLLERIWRVVNSYEKSSHTLQKVTDKMAYLELLFALKNRDNERVLELYMNQIRKLSKES